MPTPKSVVKFSKNGVEYTSEVDKCEYFIFELTRAALRDVSKYVRKKFKESYYTHFKKHSGNAGRAASAKVWSSANTQYPRVDIGLKTGKVAGFYAYFQELGSSNTKRLGLLQKAVEDNVDEIRKIESQYLSAIENESEAERLIDESETEDNDEV